MDKEDLLVQGLAMFSEELEAQLELAQEQSSASGHLLHSGIFFRHADAHHELYKAMQEGGGADVIFAAGRQHLTRDIAEHLEDYLPEGAEVQIPLPVITSFLAGAMPSVLNWWLDAGRPFPPEEINGMFQRLASQGMQSLQQS